MFTVYYVLTFGRYIRLSLIVLTCDFQLFLGVFQIKHRKNQNGKIIKKMNLMTKMLKSIDIDIVVMVTRTKKLIPRRGEILRKKIWKWRNQGQ